MTKKIWVLFSLLILVGAIALVGCTTARRSAPQAPGQTRTVPSPTRVTPPVTPGPGTTRTVPAPTRVPTPTTPVRPRTTAPTPGTTVTPGTPVPGTPGTTVTPGPLRTATPRRTENRAKAIANDIAKEKDIKGASCVVSGDTALVGLEFEKQYKGKVTDSIKKSVEKRVKKHEPSIKKVVVTADPDLLSRIKTMASDIEKGKPLSGFTTEIEEIIRRINPF